MEFLLYTANASCPQYFCGQKPDGKLLFCAAKSLAVVLPEYAAEVWTSIIADRTGHKPLCLPVDVRVPMPTTRRRDVPRVELRSDRVSPVQAHAVFGRMV